MIPPRAFRSLSNFSTKKVFYLVQPLLTEEVNYRFKAGTIDVPRTLIRLRPRSVHLIDEFFERQGSG
ncbi:MAG TPA: hypothetical protein VKB49_15270, partial [Candidatus Sulfotelmatobacter sp.]|nr:hypothetical protein [Candidatus Sulfotelmatobacter sp.]